MLARLAAVVAISLAVVVAACGATQTPGSTPPGAAPTTSPSSRPEESPTATATPSQTIEPSSCLRRSGENGWPVDVGRDPAVCVTWLPQAGTSTGYRVVLAYAESQRTFEYALPVSAREFTVPSEEAPTYQPPPQTRCFVSGGFRVTVLADAGSGPQLLGGVDVAHECLVRQFTAAGCVAPEGKALISLAAIDVKSPPSRVAVGQDLDCIAWVDSVTGEKGFRVTLAYVGGERFVYDLPANSRELVVPERDRPKGDLRERLAAGRKDFSVTITALFDNYELILTSTAVIAG